MKVASDFELTFFGDNGYELRIKNKSFSNLFKEEEAERVVL